MGLVEDPVSDVGREETRDDRIRTHGTLHGLPLSSVDEPVVDEEHDSCEKERAGDNDGVDDRLVGVVRRTELQCRIDEKLVSAEIVRRHLVLLQWSISHVAIKLALVRVVVSLELRLTTP